MDRLVGKYGKYYDHTDIHGITLSGEKLRNIDLSHIDFFSVDLSEKTFERCDFTDSWLSDANLSGTKFIRTNMHNILIDNANFNTSTNFIGINLASKNFTLASLLQELVLGQQKITHLGNRTHTFKIFKINM